MRFDEFNWNELEFFKTMFSGFVADQISKFHPGVSLDKLLNEIEQAKQTYAYREEEEKVLALLLKTHSPDTEIVGSDEVEIEGVRRLVFFAYFGELVSSKVFYLKDDQLIEYKNESAN